MQPNVIPFFARSSPFTIPSLRVASVRRCADRRGRYADRRGGLHGQKRGIRTLKSLTTLTTLMTFTPPCVGGEKKPKKSRKKTLILLVRLRKKLYLCIRNTTI